MVNMKTSEYTMRTGCKVCDRDLIPYLDLGNMPLPNDFQSKPGTQTRQFPLEVAYCGTCHLSQLTVDVNPDLMFRNFPWESSVSKPNLDHFTEIAAIASERLGMKSGDVVLDIACNDGGPLMQFDPYGVQKVGVDPATNLTKLARGKGIAAFNEYWTSKVANEVVSKYAKAKIITATQVFGHVPNIHAFVEGFKIALAQGGTCIVEAPHLVDLLDHILFDTIHHEHPSYWLLNSADILFQAHGLKVYDVEKTSVYGGSLRMFVGHQGEHQVKPSVEQMIEKEKTQGFFSLNKYKDFQTRVQKFRSNLVGFLKDLHRKKSEEERIVGFGASAKGCIMLNYCGVDNRILECVIDETRGKQGMYIPGVNLLVEGLDKLTNKDYVLILSWNFAEEIMKRTSIAKAHIIPLPHLIMHHTKT